MAERRLNRMIRQVRNWRSNEPRDELRLANGLDDAGLRQLRRVIDETIEGRGGELAARRRASAIGSAFLDLDDAGRHRFFELLADDYDHDDDEVDHAIAAVVRSSDPDSRRKAEQILRQTLLPRRERLLRRFVGIDGGLPFLIDLREELLPIRGESTSLRALDDDLRNILSTWFDVAMLRLERLDWSTPASILEKLIEYEAVHAIESWDDLRGRLGTGRRCYGYFHPAMPDEPLIFVEIALTRGISSELPLLLDHDADRIDPTLADTAIFYSISNCQAGLAGVPLGDFLIKRVVEELTNDLGNLTTFATLSPIPGFRIWLRQQLERDDLLHATEIASIAEGDPLLALARLDELTLGPAPTSSKDLEPFRPALLRLAAHYLTVERRGSRAADPVAHFHLSNGARVERINWWANPGQAGWERGLGMMVNYRYRLDFIEANHDRYTSTGHIEASEPVNRLLVTDNLRSGDGQFLRSRRAE